MGTKKGRQTIEFDNSVYIKSYYSSAGKLEGEGPLGDRFDDTCLPRTKMLPG